MNILVTGGDGQLGHALAAVKSDHQIHAINRQKFDLCNLSSMRRELEHTKPDLVINSAAWTNVKAAEDHEEEAFAVNATGAGNLAGLCAERQIGIIHISTDYVFEGEQSGSLREHDPTNPQTAYGRTKLAGEKLVANANANHAIVRTSWVYGAHGSNFLKTMLQIAEQKNTLDVVCDQFGCPTYTPHLAAGIMLIADHLTTGRQCGTIHMAGNGETSWAEFAQEIYRRSAQQNGPFATVNPIYSSQRQDGIKRPKKSSLNCTKAQTKFNIVLPDWKIGVKDCIKTLQKLN